MNSQKLFSHKMDNKIPVNLTITFPDWIKNFIKEKSKTPLITLEEKMSATIELSRLNIKNNTGGPFGAIIFEISSHKMISVGINLVTKELNSIAHAEILALMFAQKKLQTYNLSSLNRDLILISSGQPCAMCFSAIIWSGIKQVAYGAPKNDIELITGFDEGPLHHNWEKEAKKRGINIIKDVLKKDALKVLKTYCKNNGIIYNG